MIIALMIQTHTCTQISIQVIASCHRCTSKYRKTVLKCFCDRSQCVLVFFLDKLSDCLPHSITLRPFLYFFMHFFGKIERHSRLRNRIRCLVRRSPEYFQRTCLYFFLYFLKSFQTGYRNIFIQTGNHTCGSSWHDRFGIACDTQLAAFTVDMSVDHTRHQISAFCIDHLCVFANVVFHISHCYNRVFVNCDICRIDLLRHNIDQSSSHDHFCCRCLCTSCTNQFLQIFYCCSFHSFKSSCCFE